jgi:dienelactone hydrolase
MIVARTTARRDALLAVASAVELLSKSVAQTRASHGGALCSQSLAAEVSSVRVTKASSVRSITQRSPRAQPMSVKITGRATGTVSSWRFAAPKSRQVSNTSRSRWSGGQKRTGQVRIALSARS